MYYNSYEQETYRYLKNYIDWGQYRDSLEKEVKELETKLSMDPGPKGTRFGYNGGGSGGWHKDSEEETAALQREEDFVELEAKRKDLEVLADRLDRIGRALQELSPMDQAIIMQRTFYGKTWIEIAHMVHMDEKTCRDRFNRKLLRKLAIRVCGPKADPANRRRKFILL